MLGPVNGHIEVRGEGGLGVSIFLNCLSFQKPLTENYLAPVYWYQNQQTDFYTLTF